MPSYTVLPKNPVSGMVHIEADGYEWGVKRISFWITTTPVLRTEAPLRDGEARVVKLASGKSFLPAYPPVAEFAVDWVAGVITETGEIA